MQETLSNPSFKTGDVLKKPDSMSAMWRCLEVGPDRVRLVRSDKQGAIHGLVKQREGQWVPIDQAAGYTVIGHFHGQRGKAGKTAKSTAGRNGKQSLTSKSSSVKKTGKQSTRGRRGGQLGRPAGPGRKRSSSSNREVIGFIHTTLDSLSKGLRTLMEDAG